MNRTNLSRWTLPLAAALVSAACSDETKPPAQLTTLERAIAAAGGAEALLAATSERVEARGDRYFPTQGVSHTESRHLSAFQYTRTQDLEADRLRIEHDHLHDYLYDARYRFTEVIDEDAGFVGGNDSYYPNAAPETAMYSSRVSSELRHTRLVSPVQLLRSAAKDPGIATEEPAIEVGGRAHEVLSIAGADGQPPVRLLLDPVTHLPAMARTLEDSPPLGDVEIEARFSDYREVQGVRVPFRVELRADGLDLHAEERTHVELNVAAEAELFAVPSELAPPAVPFVPSLAALGRRSSQLFVSIKYLSLPIFYFDQEGFPVAFEALAPGVQHVLGMTHHSLLVELADSLLIFDAPTPFSNWSETVLAEIRRRYPTKPIRWVVASHFHNDHIGGIRHFVAGGGVTVLAGAPSVDLYERVFENPHTIAPDALSRNPVPVTVEGVTESRIIEDQTRRVEVYAVRNSHSDDALVLYLPAEKLLFVADLFSPNPATNGAPLPNPKFAEMAGELYDEVTRLELDIGRIAGAHGAGTATLEDLRLAGSR